VHVENVVHVEAIELVGADPLRSARDEFRSGFRSDDGPRSRGVTGVYGARTWVTVTPAHAVAGVSSRTMANHSAVHTENVAPWHRRRPPQRAMWPVPIVVVDEQVKDPLEALLVQHQQPVETFRADVRTHRSATPFACGVRNGVRMTSIPSLANTSSNRSDARQKSAGGAEK